MLNRIRITPPNTDMINFDEIYLLEMEKLLADIIILKDDIVCMNMLFKNLVKVFSLYDTIAVFAHTNPPSYDSKLQLLRSIRSLLHSIEETQKSENEFNQPSVVRRIKKQMSNHTANQATAYPLFSKMIPKEIRAYILQWLPFNARCNLRVLSKQFMHELDHMPLPEFFITPRYLNGYIRTNLNFNPNEKMKNFTLHQVRERLYQLSDQQKNDFILRTHAHEFLKREIIPNNNHLLFNAYPNRLTSRGPVLLCIDRAIMPICLILSGIEISRYLLNLEYCQSESNQQLCNTLALIISYFFLFLYLLKSINDAVGPELKSNWVTVHSTARFFKSLPNIPKNNLEPKEMIRDAPNQLTF